MNGMKAMAQKTSDPSCKGDRYPQPKLMTGSLLRNGLEPLLTRRCC